MQIHFRCTSKLIIYTAPSYSDEKETTTLGGVSAIHLIGILAHTEVGLHSDVYRNSRLL